MRSSKQLLGLVFIVLIAIDFAVCHQTSNDSIIKKKLNKIDQSSDIKIDTISRAKNGLLADLHSNWIEEFNKYLVKEIQKIIKILGNPTGLPSSINTTSNNNPTGSPTNQASSASIETVPTIWAPSTQQQEVGELSSFSGDQNTPYSNYPYNSGEQTLTYENGEVMI